MFFNFLKTTFVQRNQWTYYIVVESKLFKLRYVENDIQ